MFITVADFIGKFELHTGMYVQSNIQAYIDKYEKRYLIELLGATLYADFIANQVDPEFVKIIDPFDEDHDFCIISSDGIKSMLLGFVYFEYLKDLTNQITPVGNVRPVGENSADVSTLYTMMYGRYNDSIRTYRAIQYYICVGTEFVYNDYNGVRKELAYWL